MAYRPFKLEDLNGISEVRLALYTSAPPSCLFYLDILFCLSSNTVMEREENDKGDKKKGRVRGNSKLTTSFEQSAQKTGE